MSWMAQTAITYFLISKTSSIPDSYMEHEKPDCLNSLNMVDMGSEGCFIFGTAILYLKLAI